MVTLDNLRSYVDNYMIEVMRRTIRVHGVFPLALVRVKFDDTSPSGFSVDPLSSDEPGCGMYDTEDFETMKLHAVEAANDPKILGLIYVLPFDDVTDEEDNHTGSFLLIGIHVKGADLEQGTSDARMMSFEVDEIQDTDGAKDAYMEERKAEYLKDYLGHRNLKLENLTPGERERILNSYVETAWKDLKPVYFDIVSQGLWGAIPREIEGHPVPNPFEFEKDSWI